MRIRVTTREHLQEAEEVCSDMPFYCQSNGLACRNWFEGRNLLANFIAAKEELNLHLPRIKEIMEKIDG